MLLFDTKKLQLKEYIDMIAVNIQITKLSLLLTLKTQRRMDWESHYQKES